ncbi:MAG: endopeptidase La [Ruminococcaceae bacterium]|nr:endopeptidase La [Oscillospiraceae bacterium]
MPNYIEKAEKLNLPVLPLFGTVAFPSITISLETSTDTATAAVRAANEGNTYVLLLSAREVNGLNQEADDADTFYEVGTVAKIKQTIKTGEESLRIIAEGASRAQVMSLSRTGKQLRADVLCKTVMIEDNGGLKGEAYRHEAITVLEGMLRHVPAVSQELLGLARTIKNPGLLADFIAAHVLVKYEAKQAVLSSFEPLRRLEVLVTELERERRMHEIEAELNVKLREQIEQHQRENYIREQMHLLQNELGEGGSDSDDYYRRIMEAKLPAEVEEKLLKENERLAKSPFGSAEAAVGRNYLDVCLELPWNKTTRDRLDVKAAKKILDADHDGMDKVKDRILEFLAVKQLNPELRNQILCLVGPPGVGKTSIGASIARAMKRKYVRVSLGGVRDEADIRGHRKTYIGAMPGRIINALSQAGVRNPLILLDEIDKLTHDAHGDPASALLEVLDAEQNKSFRDHFIELPIDLSDCLFIATANTLQTVPRPLIDRMEIIELPIYTRHEKLAIAENHLLPKQLKRHGLTRRALKLTREAICEVIDYYTREAGVRNLERAIGDLCRKAARRMVEEDIKRVVIDAEDVSRYLGPRKALPEQIEEQDQVGIVNGLAYTELGGDLLRVEVAVLEGTGKIELTGSLGDVMKESARIAVSYIRSVAKEIDIDPDFYKNKDLHIHFPEGAVPKDGPSAGVTMVTALISALSGRPVRRELAMTGEVTLRGRVLAIGGLREKTMAAYSAGVTHVVIPADNMRDLDKLDPVVREALTFIPCKTVTEVLDAALVGDTSPKRTHTDTVPNEYIAAQAPTPRAYAQ